MNPKSLEWRLARLRYIRSVKDQLPMEFREDIERVERAMLRLVKGGAGGTATHRHPSLRVEDDWVQGRHSRRRAASGSLPQIGDTQAIFYTVDVDHTQTHSAGV
jgi:hypothetical protein